MGFLLDCAIESHPTVCISGSGVGVENARWRNQLPDADQTISAGRIPHCPLHALLAAVLFLQAFQLYEFFCFLRFCGFMRPLFFYFF